MFWCGLGQGGSSGYFVITPFEAVCDGVVRRVLVNRGWVQGKAVEVENTMSELEQPSHSQFSGVVRKGETASTFTPGNSAKSRQYHWLDLQVLQPSPWCE